MRRPRENKHNRVYHLISRVAHRAFFLDAGERDRFIGVMKRSAAFSGVRLLAWCVMTNHVHILIYVPEPEELSDEAVLSPMRTLYRKPRFDELKRRWDQLAAHHGTRQFARFRGSFLRRMWSASEFMKTLKQHFTMSYNARRAHAGTMWEGRYHVRVHRPDDFGMGGDYGVFARCRSSSDAPRDAVRRVRLRLLRMERAARRSHKRQRICGTICV